MFRYFGYGSNLNITSLLAKGVKPLSSRLATLHGWRLRFNVQHFFRHEGGVGNIEYTGKKEDRVQGVLYECPDESLKPLDDAEAYGHGYDRINVEVEVKISPFDKVLAITYVGMPEFLDDQCLPCRRYLNILLQGAKHAGLSPNYIRWLDKHPVHHPQNYPSFKPPEGDFPLFDESLLAEKPLYTALYGAVFDMAEARELHSFLKSFFGGRDMTLFHLKRLDCSDGKETMDDIRKGRLNNTQLDYINSYLNEYAREYRYVGRLDYKNLGGKS